MAWALNVVNIQKKSPGLNSETGAEHSWQIGQSVYIHSPWIPSLLAFRKKCKSLLLPLSCVSLVVKSVNMPVVNRQSVSCFKFII